MANGYIKIHRKLMEWEWYTDSIVKSVFIHLLLTVNHKEKRWQGIVIRAGETVTSSENLSKILKLGRQQIRRALQVLADTDTIEVFATNKYTHIRVKNWNCYQYDFGAEESEDKKPTRAKRNQQKTTDPTNNSTNKKPSPTQAIVSDTETDKKPTNQHSNQQKTTDPTTPKEYNNIYTPTLSKERVPPKKPIFEKPTLEEVREYCRERNNKINAEMFIDFYDSKDWYIGKNRMKDWRAAIRTWEKRETNQSNTPPARTQGEYRKREENDSIL